MKVTSTAVSRAGRTSGSAIDHSVRNSPAPSIRAASNSSFGNCMKYCRKMNTAVELMTNGRIMPR